MLKVLSETEPLTNRLLDKILKSGINSLTDFERDLLDKISKEEDLRYIKFEYIKDLYRKMGYDEADIGDIFQNNIFIGVTHQQCHILGVWVNLMI